MYTCTLAVRSPTMMTRGEREREGERGGEGMRERERERERA